MPQELKVNRSILKIFRVESHRCDQFEKEILKEKEAENEWIGKITEIYKLSNNKILKVTLDETVKATTATERSLLAFSLLMPNHS